MSFHQQYKTSICHWPQEDRPRERLIKYGEHQLSNSELLAILLRTGHRGENAVDLARKILDKFKTFRQMSHTDARQWDGFKGLGPAKMAQIKAAIEIGRRFREDEVRGQSPKIKSSRDIVEILFPRLRDLKIEVFQVAYLNSSNRLIAIEEQNQGTVNFASPILREIFQKALQHFATSVICVHNHPSGDIVPSVEDKNFTRKLVEAGRIMQVKVLDHVIIGDNAYYSFADQSLL
jgi:DNA repair protein RadC